MRTIYVIFAVIGWSWAVIAWLYLAVRLRKMER
jgi:hypothetical protein